MASLEKLLEESRRELLDLSTRNRLLAIPVDSKSARVIQICEEKSDVVFRLLVEEQKTMGFLPGVEKKSESSATEAAVLIVADSDEEEVGLPQPDNEIDEAHGARRHADTKLQTALTSDALQRRLLGLYRDAQLIMEEQGVNILYLALGRLKWFEAEKADTPRHAPLVLVPVQLQRRSAIDRFTLKWREEDVQENLSLAAKLKSEFGIELPKFPLEEVLVPSRYAETVAKAVAGQQSWQVQADAMTLAFFSFAKFLMYRDLDPRTWPDPTRLLTHPALGDLLRDGFPAVDRPFTEDVNLDELIPAARLDHVVDADGSQTLAIEMVRQGRSVVIQGPPGTGKSQSITNLIATAVLDGKKVLFVAEKLAALEVVKRRLEATGLGALCLELHSHKAHKRAVLEEISRTWQLGRPRGQELEAVVKRLEQTRSRLNGHASMLHTRLEPSGVTPFSILGVLALLGERGWELGEVDFAEATTWTADGLRERRALVGELAERVRQMGSPSAHPWRGVERETVLNIDLPRIRETLERLAVVLPPLRAEAQRLASLLRQPEPSDLSRTEAIRRMSAHVAAAPTLDRDALCNGVWLAGLDGLRDLVAHGRAFAEIRTKLTTGVTDEAFETDLTSARAAIAAHGRSWFRLLNKEFRKGMAALRGVLRGEPPSAHVKRIALFDDLLAARRQLLALRERAEMGSQAFGVAWHSEDSDWEQLTTVIAWVSGEAEACLSPDFRETFGALDRREDFGDMSASLGKRLGEAWLAAKAMKDEVALNLVTAFGRSAFESVPLAALEERLGQWRARLEDLTRWNTWFLCAARTRQLGLGAIIEAMEADRLPHASAADVFDRAYYSRLLREAVRMLPQIAQFDGLEHGRIVEDFRRVDLDRLTLAKYRVLAKHYDSLPLRHAGVGSTGILLAELERKRGHRPVRKLLKDAGSVIQAIKPVFMMSPLSAAQFLEPGALDFDLLVIDEASQVQPVDAFGAFARAKQHVVVGDSKQLPPTRFFTRLTSNEDDENGIAEEDMPAAQAKDVESILGLCCARGVPETMLRWHYRSRHHSLIAVSNREFYENKLFIVPSPLLVVAGLGLAFRFVEGGIYDRGQSGTNRVEAGAVCRAILDHARQQPVHSLGVAAFSVRQKQAIEDELELLRREHPELESFFHAHPHEPFFVKNLENVQGDERDVIFISVGYGPDTSGYIAMNFGPLSSEGGERRLNVLISRAKRRCVVFASLRADDIDLARVTGRGVRCFKAFLQFAESGRLAMAERTARDEDSPFEEAVRRAIESLGYEVHPQVGIAGFFVDLGVIDPVKRGRYLLGIECDGAAYHSSRSARDRDRLRQAVLEDHGWIIHRIWSTDWFQRPGEQLRKVAAALEQAKIALAEAQPAPAPPTDSDIQREANHDDVVVPTEALAAPYVEARFVVPPATQPHELTVQQMADVLFRIVQVEGPVHEDELTARVRDLWGLGRAGSRIQDSVARGIRALLVSGRCHREDNCLFLPQAPIPVRSREVVRSASLRKADQLPPQELRAAIESVVVAHYGASTREITVAVSRLLGFKAMSAGLRESIERQVQILKAKGRLREQDGLFRKVS
jgi:very-short-patch-repair endonuclease